MEYMDSYFYIFEQIVDYYKAGWRGRLFIVWALLRVYRINAELVIATTVVVVNESIERTPAPLLGGDFTRRRAEGKRNRRLG